MAETVFATKGNLMTVKNSLKLSTQGYELLDKKRTILINEMMLSLIHIFPKRSGRGQAGPQAPAGN